MAGVPGFEPGMPIPKTGALPLGYTPLPKMVERKTTQYQIKKQAQIKPRYYIL